MKITIENKSKSRIKTKSKILVLGLILIILAGLFGPTGEVQAQTEERCWRGSSNYPLSFFSSKAACEGTPENPTGNTWGMTGTATTTTNTNLGTATTPANPGELDFGCSFPFITKMGCLAGLSYLLWTISSFVAQAAGHFLDFFVYYSINSDSYRNVFVEKGWAVVRDVANIFFIIALLYIAIKTVLSLEGSNSKKMIANIIIIALIINFSLFTTKVVIDGTNILAKIFYNSITSVNASGQPLDTVEKGQTSISIGLVRSFNPTSLIKPEGAGNYDAGQFTFVALLLFAITIYTAYVFFAVALLFVARVISLWLSMIFAPLAFISYTVPFDIPGFGHKRWWDDLLKNAFLAPLFVFFLYMIVMFTNFLPDVAKKVDTAGLPLMQSVMAVVIPFVLLMMLLMKAKKLAVEYSGDMGKAVMTAGKMIGGAALGGAALTTAFAGKRIIGGLGGAAAQKMGLKRTSEFLRNRSFDFRAVPGAGKLLGATGMAAGAGLFGKAQQGGWSEMKKQQMEKRQKRAEVLKKRDTVEEKKEVDDAEIELKEKLLNTEVPDKDGIKIPVKLALENADKEIDKARIALNDIKGTDNPEGAKKALAELRKVQDAKEKIRGITITRDDKGKVLTKEIESDSIAELETTVHRKKAALEVKSDEITTAYAKKISSKPSKFFNTAIRLGAYSSAGADEAGRNIRTGTKLDSGEKPK